MFGGVTTPVSSEGLSIHGSNEAWLVGSSLFEVPVFNECQSNSLEQWGRSGLLTFILFSPRSFRVHLDPWVP